MQKKAYYSKMVRDTAKVCIDHSQQTVGGLSTTGLGETLHRSPRNAESFRIKRRAFRLVTPDGGLLVELFLPAPKAFPPARPPVRPPVRPGYDDKYRSRSYRFGERQKL